MPLNGTVKASVTVTNTGSRAGDEIVQLYIHDVYATSTRPVKELKRFGRVTLQAGESRRIEIELPVSELAFWGADGVKQVEPGDFQLWVAGDSASGEPLAFKVQ